MSNVYEDLYNLMVAYEELLEENDELIDEIDALNDDLDSLTEAIVEYETERDYGAKVPHVDMSSLG